MAVTVYSSYDAGAPVARPDSLGGMIAILKACLVDGYGAKTAAGWTMPFIAGDSRAAVFRNSPTTGTGTYFRVDQSVSMQHANFRGYESMSDVDTGVRSFPNMAQMSGSGLYLHCGNSTTTSNNSGIWYIIANERAVHIFVLPYLTSAADKGFDYIFLGDLISFSSNTDPYRSCIWGKTTLDWNYFGNHLVQQELGSGGQIYINRDITGLSVSRQGGIMGNMGISKDRLGKGYLAVVHTFPNPVDGNMIITNVFVHHDSYLRGKIPGLKATCHAKPFSNLTPYSGDGDLAGKSFTVFNTGNTANNYSDSQIMIEISDTWYA